jgi:hypothetical protein
MSDRKTAEARPLIHIFLGVFAVGLGILALLLLLLAGTALYLSLDRAAEFRSQAARVATLRTAPKNPAPSLGADLAIPDATPLARLRLLATHNSYRRSSNPVGSFLIGLMQPGEAAKLAYAHAPLTTQLDEGIRSFELDVRARRADFVLSHVPLVDSRTWEPDFRLALEELVLWSERNPGHLPLVLLLELKEDYRFLDPALEKWKAKTFDRLDAALEKGLGPRLFRPADLAATDLAAAGRAGGQTGARAWPSVGSLRGRVLVVLHENEAYRAIYEEGHPGLAGRAMFDCLPDGAPGAFFAILNDPLADGTKIAAATARGSIVRTRADADLALSPEALAAALASGAQIVSTDFPPGHPGPGGYTAALPGGLRVDVLP